LLLYKTMAEPINAAVRRLDILSFVRTVRLNWIGRVNRMDSARKVSLILNNNPQGSRLRGRPKNRWWNCVQTNVNKCTITNWKERSKSLQS